MPKIRFRYLLPFGHLFVDIICLLYGIRHIDAVRGRVKSDLNPRSIVRPMMLQEARAPGWDFRYVYVAPLEEYVFLGLGNLPAGIVAVSVRSHGALLPSRDSLWDPWWFLIQEAIAFPLWFAAGVYADSRAGRFAVACRWYLILRFALAAFLFVPLVVWVGLLAEYFFWLALIVYLLAWVIAWSYSFLRRIVIGP